MGLWVCKEGTGCSLWPVTNKFMEHFNYSSHLTRCTGLVCDYQICEKHEHHWYKFMVYFIICLEGENWPFHWVYSRDLLGQEIPECPKCDSAGPGLSESRSITRANTRWITRINKTKNKVKQTKYTLVSLFLNKVDHESKYWKYTGQVLELQH